MPFRSALWRRTSRLAVLLATTSNAVTKGVLAAPAGPRPYLLRVLLGQGIVLAATWSGWLVARA